jgi:hypothetical protein
LALRCERTRDRALDDWLRGLLKRRAETLPNSKRLESEGFFMRTDMRTDPGKWREHQAGQRSCRITCGMR